MPESAAGVHSEAPFTLRMAKAMADPLRIRILLELNQRDMSATQFFEQFGGGSVTRVYRHFKVLAEYGWLVKVGKKSGFETLTESGEEAIPATVALAAFESPSDVIRAEAGGA